MSIWALVAESHCWVVCWLVVWEVSGACGIGERSSGQGVVLRWVEEASCEMATGTELIVEAVCRALVYCVLTEVLQGVC